MINMYSQLSTDSILTLKKVGPDNTKAQIDPEPFQIVELQDIVSIKTGDDHFLALKSDGSLYAMGEDKYGQ